MLVWALFSDIMNKVQVRAWLVLQGISESKVVKSGRKRRGLGLAYKKEILIQSCG